MAALALYTAVGPRLTHYEVDVEGAALRERGALDLPAGLMYAWPHATRRFLYAACSDGGLSRAAATLTAASSVQSPLQSDIRE